jgi:hypothetical protein
MSAKTTYWCDRTECLQHTESPEKLGWVKVRIAIAFHCYPWNYASDATLGHNEEILHLCSADCSLKVMSKWLGDQKK